MRIEQRINVEDIPWDSLEERLQKRFQVAPSKASKILSRLRRRLRSPFELSWFRSSSLSRDENQAMALLCEQLGADRVIILFERTLSLIGVRIQYRQEVGCSPSLKELSSDTPKGSSFANIEIEIFGRRIKISKFWQIVSCYLAFSLFGIATYVIGIGLLLYGLSVFLLFLYVPDLVLVEATRKGRMGLALLCFLVVFAAILGRAVANIVRLAASKRRSGGIRQG